MFYRIYQMILLSIVFGSKHHRARHHRARLVALGSEFNPNRPFHDSSLGIAYSPLLAPPLAFHSQPERYRMSLIKVADTLKRTSRDSDSRRKKHDDPA